MDKVLCCDLAKKPTLELGQGFFKIILIVVSLVIRMLINNRTPNSTEKKLIKNMR